MLTKTNPSWANKLLNIALIIQVAIALFFYFDYIYNAIVLGPPTTGFSLGILPIAVYGLPISFVALIVTAVTTTSGLLRKQEKILPTSIFYRKAFLSITFPVAAGIPLQTLFESQGKIDWIGFVISLFIMLIFYFMIFHIEILKRSSMSEKTVSVTSSIIRIIFALLIIFFITGMFLTIWFVKN